MGWLFIGVCVCVFKSVLMYFWGIDYLLVLLFCIGYILGIDTSVQ